MGDTLPVSQDCNCKGIHSVVIVTLICTDPTVKLRLYEFANIFGIPDSFLERKCEKLVPAEKTIQMVIDTWISRNGSNSTVSKLSACLKTLQLNWLDEKLHNQFSNEQIIKPSCHLSQKELNYEQDDDLWKLMENTGLSPEPDISFYIRNLAESSGHDEEAAMSIIKGTIPDMERDIDRLKVKRVNRNRGWFNWIKNDKTLKIKMKIKKSAKKKYSRSEVVKQLSIAPLVKSIGVNVTEQ